MDKIMEASEQIALFCRLNTHIKRDFPIRSSEMGMLIYLVKSDGKKTPQGVSKFFNVTKSMATNMTTSLLLKGYIEKKQSVEDKRSFVLVPTKKAIRLVETTYEDYFKTITLLKSKMKKKSFEEFLNLLVIANTILKEKKNG